MLYTTINSPEAPAISWQAGAPAPSLGRGEVHVWQVPLRAVDTTALYPLLSRDERGRAARFRFDRQRNEYVSTRGVLRLVLGRYTGQPPSDIRFHYNEFGKPWLENDPGPGIAFNVSHSEGLALLAVGRNVELGIDLEQIRCGVADDEGVVRQTLTAREMTQFSTLPESERHRYFFDCWTRREAYLKACGHGFSTPEPLAGVGSAHGGASGADESRTLPFNILGLPPIDGYAAAIVVYGNMRAISFMRYAASS